MCITIHIICIIIKNRQPTHQWVQGWSVKNRSRRGQKVAKKYLKRGRFDYRGKEGVLTTFDYRGLVAYFVYECTAL